MPAWLFCPKCATRLTAGAPTCPGCGTQMRDFTPTDGGGTSADSPDLGAAIEAELRETLAPGLLLLKALGHGGMGTVYLARDPALKRNVVVKVLAPWLAHDPTARTRFEREAQAAAAVAHPNVVSVFQVGTLPQSGTSYFVMQHVEGQTLEQAFPPGTLVPEGRAMRIIGEIAAALAAAHKRGLVHRDIKPANVMVETETDRVVVLDFGISAAASPARKAELGTKLTQEGSSVGTPTYMSPEQAAGEEVTAKSDVYSLGVVAFELLTGRPLFEETSPMALIAAHIKQEPPRVAIHRGDVDRELGSIVDRCLAKDPKERPAASDIARYVAPASQPLIEWPPPGLQPLWGLGAALTRLTARVVVLGIACLTLLYLQPQITTASWWKTESSWFWNTVYVGSVADQIFGQPTECAARASTSLECTYPVEVGVLRHTGMLALTALAIVEFVALVRRGGILAIGLRRARRLGYPEAASMIVAWDDGTDTPDLLNGTGRHALQSAEHRMRAWRRHLRVTQWHWAGLAASALLPCLWVSGVWHLGPTGDRWLNGMELLLCALPLACAIVVRRTAIGRRASRANRRPQPDVRVGKVSADGYGELAAAWAHSLDSRWYDRALPRARVLLTGVVVTGAAVVAFAGAVTLLAYVLSVSTAPTFRSWARTWMDHVDADSAGTEQWAGIDSSLVTLIRQGLSATNTRPFVRMPIPADDPSASPLPYQAELADPRMALSFALQDLKRGEIQNGTMRRLQAVADSVRLGEEPWASIGLHPWQDGHFFIAMSESTVVGEVRRLGRAAGRESSEPGTRIGSRRAARLATAVLAFEQGQHDAARRLIAETLAWDHLQWHHPTDSDLHFSAGRELRATLGVSEQLGRYASDSLAALTAARIGERLERERMASRLFFLSFEVSTLLMGDPVAPLGERYVGNDAIPPALRLSLAVSALTGFCGNGREILLGVSPRRPDLAARVDQALADAPELREYFHRAGAVLDTAVTQRPGILGAFRRMAWCFGERPNLVF